MFIAPYERFSERSVGCKDKVSSRCGVHPPNRHAKMLSPSGSCVMIRRSTIVLRLLSIHHIPLEYYFFVSPRNNCRITYVLKMASLNPSDLFSVQGLVAVITGGGTGKL